MTKRVQIILAMLCGSLVACLYFSSPVQAVVRDSLGPNEQLNANEGLTSSDGRFSLIMQSDGNLVLYHNNGVGGLWASWTVGSGASYAVMQSDGNFVLYKRDNTPVWSSNTVGSASTLRLQNDGNLVIYRNSGGSVWATNTMEFGLGPNEQLLVNERLVSSNNRFSLIMQSDGNLVLYRNNGGGLWASGTAGTGASRAVMQSDGNLVLYSRDNTPVWASNTLGGKSSVLRLQGDGNLVIYRDGENAIWGTNTRTTQFTTLGPDERLLAGERIIMTYPFNRYLTMQSDGNLVVYDHQRGPVWATGTNGTGASYAIIQSDGNLVLYRTNNTPVWSSNTMGGRSMLDFDDDTGNLYIRRIGGVDSGRTVWATNIKVPPTPPTPNDTTKPTIKFDMANARLTGYDFAPNQTVYIRVVVIGQIGQLADFREGRTQTSSDSTGRINTPLILRSVLPVFDDGYGFVWEGCYSGERIGITAHDDRRNSKRTDFLWSNAYEFWCP